jgi:hypothetical protein
MADHTQNSQQSAPEKATKKLEATVLWGLVIALAVIAIGMLKALFG